MVGVSACVRPRVPCYHSLRGLKVPDSAVPRPKLVVAGRFGEVESPKNRQMFLVQPGPLGDGPGVGGQGDQPDGVQGVGDVAPGVTGLDLDGADQQQGEPAQLDVADDPILASVVDRAQVELLEILEAAEGRKFAISEGWVAVNFGKKGS